MGLRALLIICYGVVRVSAVLLPPRDLTISSQNFKHILTWRDPNNVTSMFYRVMYSSMFLDFIDSTDCSNVTTPLCDLSKDLTEINDSYRVRVLCFTDQDSSKPSGSVFLTPVQNTVLGPPIVDIVTCDRGIQVSIRPPVSHLWSEDEQQYVSLVSHDVFARMNCRIMLQNNTAVSFQDEHISEENTTFNYSVLPNTNYCVSVNVTADSNSRPLKPPIPSKMKCVLTDKLVSDSSTVYITVSVVSGVLLLVGLFLVLYALDKAGYICREKTGIPKFLDLEPITARNHALPGMLKMVASIQFLANGSFQRLGALCMGMSQPAMCRALDDFLKGMRRILPTVVYFPTSEQEVSHMKTKWYKIAQMPNVLGAIDCTHVNFIPPVEEEHIYRNRKMGHSMNIQMVAGPDLQIMSLVAGFPGSCHDSHILRNSGLYTKFEDGNLPEGWLLGDSGYPCLPWLMTPMLREDTAAQTTYNRAHKKTRAVVERAFGLLKIRFRCLDKSGGYLQYRPPKVVDIVGACVVLHNLAIKHRVQDYIAEEEGMVENIHALQYDGPANDQGNSVRAQLINRFFAY